MGKSVSAVKFSLLLLFTLTFPSLLAAQPVKTAGDFSLEGRWKGSYNNTTTELLFNGNTLEYTINGATNEGTFLLESTGTVLLLTVEKALSRGNPVDLDQFEESDTYLAYPIAVASDGNLIINGYIYRGEKPFNSISDIYGTFISSIGENISFKEGEKFTVTDRENNAYSGFFSILPAYNLIFYTDGRKRNYSLVTGGDFILLSGKILRK